MHRIGVLPKPQYALQHLLIGAVRRSCFAVVIRLLREGCLRPYLPDRDRRVGLRIWRVRCTPKAWVDDAWSPCRRARSPPISACRNLPPVHCEGIHDAHRPSKQLQGVIWGSMATRIQRCGPAVEFEASSSSILCPAQVQFTSD